MIRHIFIIILYSLINNSFAQISAKIIPDHAAIDETLQYIITQTHTNNNTAPDLNPLRQDFNIIGTQRSMSYSFINGQSQSNTQWIIILSPKKTGTITIPEVQIGPEKTRPIQIEITNRASNNATPSPELTLKTQVDSAKALLNQQVIYTVQLLHAAQVIDSNYQPPQVEDALIVPLNNASPDKETYAIFPQKSGKIVIHPPQINALVYDVVPHKIFAQGDPITITVLPQPITTKQLPYWLPAKKVTLSEHFPQATSDLKEGDTLTRQITVKAIGAPSESLPILNFQSTQQITAYPEKPKLENSAENHNLVGTQTYTVSYLIHDSGKITLPPISIQWYNTVTQTVEKSEIPSQELTVIQTTSQANSSQTYTNATPKHPPKSLPKISTTKQPIKENSTLSSSNIAWLISLTFALLWIITLILYWKKQPKKSRKKYELPPITPIKTKPGTKHI